MIEWMWICWKKHFFNVFIKRSGTVLTFWPCVTCFDYYWCAAFYVCTLSCINGTDIGCAKIFTFDYLFYIFVSLLLKFNSWFILFSIKVFPETGPDFFLSVASCLFILTNCSSWIFFYYSDPAYLIQIWS